MADTPFKTPNKFTRKINLNRKRSNSSPSSLDSDESLSSGPPSSNGAMSLVVLFDDLCRKVNQELKEKYQMGKQFYAAVEEMRKMYACFMNTKEECQQLQRTLENTMLESRELERSLNRARAMLDEEKTKRRLIQVDLDEQLAKISMVLETFGAGNCNINDIKRQLANLHSHGRKSLDSSGRLSHIKPINSTGSILSDLSVSCSEDNLDESLLCESKKWRKARRPSQEGHVQGPAQKKRRSASEKPPVLITTSETVRATTTLTITKEGPIKATSVIESIPENGEGVHQGTPGNTPESAKSYHRQHEFERKTNMLLGSCAVCSKLLGFAKSIISCKECKNYCHVECKDRLPLPCIPKVHTPNNRKCVAGMISDYTPVKPPMVPPLIVRCVEEIEERGIQEIGVYRVPGSENEVKNLYEKLLTSRSSINLRDVDIHVICCCIKFFLRSLSESLITEVRCKDFFDAVNAKDPQDTQPALFQLIQELPRPNRDTLAYLILHLQRVAQSPDCKMPVENIAKVFGPTIVGYTTQDMPHERLIKETRHSITTMEHLLNLPPPFWRTFMENNLQATPSTESLKNWGSRFLTPKVGSHMKKRIFSTPPSYKKK